MARRKDQAAIFPTEHGLDSGVDLLGHRGVDFDGADDDDWLGRHGFSKTEKARSRRAVDMKKPPGGRRGWVICLCVIYGHDQWRPPCWREAGDSVLAILDLTYIDELVGARLALHGGERGAPRIVNGHRVGASINRSCIVMLSALMQAFIEDVFMDCAKEVFPNLRNDNNFSAYEKSFPRWGNPSAENVEKLFLRIGIVNVFEGFVIRGADEAAIRRRLNELNQVRNQIAHGIDVLRLNGAVYRLSLNKADILRKFARRFGDQFERHALIKARPQI
jgi:hypothetical protein